MTPPGYAEAFERFQARTPLADPVGRRSALARFLDQGFPDRSTEAWHYTDLSALNDRRFDLPPHASATLLPAPLDGTDRLVFVDGQLVAEASSAAALDYVATVRTLDRRDDATDAGTDPLLALNTAFATPGLDLHLAAGQRLSRPLHLLFVGTAAATPSMSHQRHRIALAAHAVAQVFVELCGDSAAERLATQRLDIELGPGARLGLVRVQREQAGSTLLATTRCHLDRDAVLKTVLVDAGRGLSRHQLTVTLAAPGADAALHALCMPTAKAHDDTQVRLVHAAPHGRSRLGFRGIVDDHAKAIFNGRVVVERGAQKTDSEQRIATLLLSPRAEINAKPELEIHADDVKCAHGATVGQLDAAARGYLRSRGIDDDTVHALLLRAFAIEALQPIDFPPLRRHVEALLGFTVDDAVGAAPVDA